MALLVDVFFARRDNLGYLAHDTATGRTAAIDAPEVEPIRTALARRGWRLSDILVTHHHADHVEAIAPLKAAFGAVVTGPAAEAERIDGLDRTVAGGDVIELGETRFTAIHTPGHTLGHLCYHDAAGGHLFTGDALFSLGCGRMIAGTAEPMWEGLLRLRALPDDTLVYCGHDYTLANARFALSVDPDNPVLRRRAEEARRLAAEGRPTSPSRLGEEKAANPFLRADCAQFAAFYALAGAPSHAVFAALRRAKDDFRA